MIPTIRPPFSGIFGIRHEILMKFDDNLSDIKEYKCDICNIGNVNDPDNPPGGSCMAALS